MSILVDENTRLLVQGITGREGTFHALRCMEYGTNLVAGVTPGRGGTTWEEKVPVFNSISEAVAETGANVGLIFVPAAFAVDAILESADAGVPLVACITEGIPVMDMVRVGKYLEDKPTTLIGPNCPGLISPGGKAKVGHHAGQHPYAGQGGCHIPQRHPYLRGRQPAHGPGNRAVQLCGHRGDPIVGTSFVGLLELFQNDPDTDAVVLIGEIGGTKEQEAAEYIRDHFTKPVVVLIVGTTAPPGKRMGHAGAIITGSAARAEEKVKGPARGPGRT